MKIATVGIDPAKTYLKSMASMHMAKPCSKSN